MQQKHKRSTSFTPAEGIFGGKGVRVRSPTAVRVWIEGHEVGESKKQYIGASSTVRTRTTAPTGGGGQEASQGAVVNKPGKVEKASAGEYWRNPMTTRAIRREE